MLTLIFRDPLWFLVNVTIFQENAEKINFMFDDMLAQLERYLAVYCHSEPQEERLPSCEMREYVQTKKYVETIDELIHKHLLKRSEDTNHQMIILQFLKIQELFEERLKTLFREKLVCPGEARAIKNEYM